MSREIDQERGSAPPSDPTQTAWPYWMLRYVGSDDPQALDDLSWSVGGSPPYGGISYEEGAAVYELIEDYLGPGEASLASYQHVEAMLEKAPERLQALAIFQCNDQVTSRPDDYAREPVQRGLELARSLGHRGAEATFLSFDAGWHHRQGDLENACRLTLEALNHFLELVERDGVYEKRVQQAAQNAISFTALGGDLAGARDLFSNLSELLDPDGAEQLRSSLERG